MREVVATLLGLAQDGGFPQPGCNRGCCAGAWGKPAAKLSPVALGIVGIDGSTHLFEATRDMGTNFKKAKNTLLKFTDEFTELKKRAKRDKATAQDAYADRMKGEG